MVLVFWIVEFNDLKIGIYVGLRYKYIFFCMFFWCYLFLEWGIIIFVILDLFFGSVFRK